MYLVILFLHSPYNQILFTVVHPTTPLVHPTKIPQWWRYHALCQKFSCALLSLFVNLDYRLSGEKTIFFMFVQHKMRGFGH